MFTKTNNVLFTKYGKEVPDGPHISDKTMIIDFHGDKPYHQIYYSKAPVTIRLDTGIMLIDVSYDPTMKEYDRFLMFRDIRLSDHVYFNFHSLAEISKISVFGSDDICSLDIDHEIEYRKIVPGFVIDELIDCFYSVRNTSYDLKPETHNFWELNYVDSGECIMSIDHQDFDIGAQQLILFGPGEQHSINTIHKGRACSYLSISFSSDMVYHEKLNRHVFTVDKKMYHLLNEFVSCSGRIKEYDDDLMISYLKILLIQLIQHDEKESRTTLESPIQQKFENELMNEITAYINKHITEALTLDDICRKFSISKSTLQILFRKNLNTSPKQYFFNQKLQKSRLMIKEGRYTISQIAIQMGFSSVNYFSKKFKEKYGMPPSEYEKTIYS